MIEIFQNQLLPIVSDTIKVNSVAYDLSGCTVKFRMRPVDGTTLKVDAMATILVAASGTVQYGWATGNTDTVGDYAAWWSITLPSTKVQDTPEFPVSVIAHAPSTVTNLCTLSDIHTVLRITTATDPRDAIIEKYIVEATKQIQQHCNREFVPQVTSTTRRFPVAIGQQRSRVNFSPFDLQAVTGAGVVLHPESSQVTLDDTNYELRPIVSDDPVYTSMIISPWISLVSSRQLKFGRPLVDVTGTWGWPSLPSDVKRACEITVQSWMRRDASGLGGAAAAAMNRGTSEAAPVGQATFFLPYAAQQLLEQYQRDIGAF